MSGRIDPMKIRCYRSWNNRIWGCKNHRTLIPIAREASFVFHGSFNCVSRVGESRYVSAKGYLSSNFLKWVGLSKSMSKSTIYCSLVRGMSRHSHCLLILRLASENHTAFLCLPQRSQEVIVGRRNSGVWSLCLALVHTSKIWAQSTPQCSLVSSKWLFKRDLMENAYVKVNVPMQYMQYMLQPGISKWRE